MLIFSEKTAAIGNVFLEAEFFDRADTLWEQLEKTLGQAASNGSGFLRQVSSAGAYAFLLATADQIFAQDSVLAFLNRMRRWGEERLGALHASTPQIHIYVDGCHRELAPDAIRTRWHYLYSLTRSEAASVRLLGDDGLREKRFGIALSRVTRFQLPFNQHETSQAYAIDAPKRTMEPLEGAILLHGYLW